MYLSADACQALDVTHALTVNSTNLLYAFSKSPENITKYAGKVIDAFGLEIKGDLPTRAASTVCPMRAVHS